MLKKTLLAISAVMCCGWMVPSAYAQSIQCDNVFAPTIFFPPPLQDGGTNANFTVGNNYCQFSPNAGFLFVFQTDGNLVFYNTVKAIWATHTEGGSGSIGKGARLSIQADGNLVVYNASNQPLWASHTNGDNNNDETLEVQNNSNTVIYESGHAKWDTAHNPVPGP
jgi:hypothetical protein